MLPLSDLHVLVIDDQDDIRFFVVNLLEINGAKVRACESADQALKAFIERNPDVIVSDILMPEHDGYWLLRHIRCLPPEQGRDIPAIALTSLCTDKDRARAFSAGFQVFMTKHVMFDDLIGAVEAVTKAGAGASIASASCEEQVNS